MANESAILRTSIKLLALIALGIVLVLSSLGKSAAASTYQKAKVSRKRQPKPSHLEIREAQQRLSELGFWTGPIDGIVGQAFRHALIAFQKVEGRPRTGRLTREELQAITSAKRPTPLEAGPFHVEIDLDRQVLFVVDTGGAISKILPVSTGNGKLFTTSQWTAHAVTPRGRFKVYRKMPGWRKSELGLMYYPSYIVGGIAIHGSNSVPAKPASHGCIRIPMFAATEFSEMTPIGTPVIVYDGASRKRIEASSPNAHQEPR